MLVATLGGVVAGADEVAGQGGDWWAQGLPASRWRASRSRHLESRSRRWTSVDGYGVGGELGAHHPSLLAVGTEHEIDAGEPEQSLPPGRVGFGVIFGLACSEKLLRCVELGVDVSGRE